MLLSNVDGLVSELSSLGTTIESKKQLYSSMVERENLLTENIFNEETKIVDLTKALELSIFLLEKCQNDLKTKIENLVTLCLQEIMGDEYGFEIKFENKRGQLESSPRILYNDKSLDPNISVGGGLIDICGAALKVIRWYLDPNRTDPIILMDEPFRHLSRSKQINASNVLNSLAETLGLQFLIITHSEELASSSDIVYKVSKINGNSLIMKQ